MCCETYWKRITIFCLALGIGTFVADLWISKKTPESNKSKSSVSREKKCVFADNELKYETLPLKREGYVPQNGNIPELKPIPSEKRNLKKTEIETKQENLTESNPQLNIPSQSSAEFQTLLHKENCYESDAQK